MVKTALCVLVLAAPLAAQNCSSFSGTFSSFQVAKDSKEHSTYNHANYFGEYGSCVYSAQANTNNCAISCSTDTSPSYPFEHGSVTGLRQHGINAATVAGNAGSNGPSITCGGQYAVAVRSCYSFLPNCDVTVGISGSSHGIGGSVSISPSALWNITLGYPYTCGAQSSAPTQCQPAGPPPYGGNGVTYSWDYASCQWVPSNSCPNQSCGSPIVIDTEGTGFHLTSAKDGVVFDFFGDGHPIRIAWTEKGSQNGWLALPDKDGHITSARDLFGNLTPQYLMASHPPNGFSALAAYDDPGKGGNNNNIIDPGDAVWGKLRVWIDRNHDGVAQPDELKTLDELGIGQIDLAYTQSPYVDRFGNQFRYKGKLVPVNANDDIDRKIFDVFLATK